MLSHSFQHGYRVSDNLAQTLRQQRKDTCENLIVCFDDYNSAEEDNFVQLDRMARLAKSGRRIIYNPNTTTRADHSFFGLIDKYDGGDWSLDLKAKDEPKIDPSKINLLPFPILDANHRLSMSEQGGQESVFGCMIGKSFLKLDLASGRFSRNIDFDHSGQNGILLRRSLLRFEQEEDAPLIASPTTACSASAPSLSTTRPCLRAALRVCLGRLDHFARRQRDAHQLWAFCARMARTLAADLGRS